ncbi:MAG: hybrid sensor histidine kinase/response regulator [Aquabacterium sp.]|nr:MAG: hybrid sensor histidine kinase/response regulator [Aquabacterium sp.]
MSSISSLFPETLAQQAKVDTSAMLPDAVRATYRQNVAALLGHGLGLTSYSVLMWNTAPRAQLLGWIAVFVLLLLGRLGMHYAFLRAKPKAVEEYARWGLRWNLSVLANAAVWMGAVWMFYGVGEWYHRTTLMLIVYSYAIGTVPYMPSQFGWMLARMLAYFVPFMVRIAIGEGPGNIIMTLIWALMFWGSFTLGMAFRRMFGDLVRLKLRNEDLAIQLKAEMEVAERAQMQAEMANRAKTQFFAAASHDLRQPLHAMGLFAEALRQRSKDEEVVHLVNSINSSVDALEGLFSELLDITKIDSGSIEVEPEHFSVRDLFDRLRLHFEPTAFEKGLALTFHGEQHFAHADPVLVERVLRNLVSNAIRYTEDGGLLVSCRRRGDKLLVQVWDSGIGISESALPRIFEEFYQVNTGRPLEAHHRKGLGLGLAIVKRLADLMDAPLTVRSRVGHGTTFSLVIPVGKQPRMQSVSISSKAPTGLTLNGKFIVIVEDEPAVKEGLHVLIKGWGAEVESFDTVAKATTWAQVTSRKPDLLIVDFRLPEQQTGIDAIKVIRERFGHVAAIMVTGSTMVGHEDEARKNDFHILLKPVVPNKLRAIVAFKLGMRQGG